MVSLQQHAAYRHGTPARRLYTALKQRLRQRREERLQWTLADVEAVLRHWQAPPNIPDQPKRLRIMPINPGLPLIPTNAHVVL